MSKSLNWTLEECVDCALSLDVYEREREECFAELATLRAKAEAWDKVAFLYPFADGPVLCAEFDEQIERLKKLALPETEGMG